MPDPVPVAAPARKPPKVPVVMWRWRDAAGSMAVEGLWTPCEIIRAVTSGFAPERRPEVEWAMGEARSAKDARWPFDA